MFITTIIVVSLIFKKHGSSELITMLFSRIKLTAIFITSFYYINKSMDEFTQETEEKIKSDYKFKACFNNLKESIILVSNG